jgi:hypothetical protein
MNKRLIPVRMIMIFVLSLFEYGCISTKPAQTSALENTLWKTNNLFGLNTEQSTYTLNLQKSEVIFGNWGNFVRFERENKFVSYYTAVCGNDCILKKITIFFRYI